MNRASDSLSNEVSASWLSRWSGPLMVVGLLLLSLTTGTIAVVLILGKGKEGSVEIPHAYEKAVQQANDSRHEK